MTVDDCNALPAESRSRELTTLDVVACIAPPHDPDPMIDMTQPDVTTVVVSGSIQPPSDLLGAIEASRKLVQQGPFSIAVSLIIALARPYLDPTSAPSRNA